MQKYWQASRQKLCHWIAEIERWTHRTVSLKQPPKTYWRELLQVTRYKNQFGCCSDRSPTFDAFLKGKERSFHDECMAIHKTSFSQFICDATRRFGLQIRVCLFLCCGVTLGVGLDIHGELDTRRARHPWGLITEGRASHPQCLQVLWQFIFFRTIQE